MGFYSSGRKQYPGAITVAVVIIVTVSILADTARGQPSTTTVKIWNALEEGVTMTVDCVSEEGTDLGVQWVGSKGSYQFDFEVIDDPRHPPTTAYTCTFQWPGGNSHKHLIYYQARDFCGECLWSIIDAGPCNYDVIEKAVLCAQWLY